MKSIANYGARHDRINITIKDFFKSPIMLPTIPEQTKTANFLTNLDNKIKLVEKELSAVKDFNKGLLQKMFV